MIGSFEKKKKELEDAIRNAELFIATLRVVDMGMVNQVRELHVELEAFAGHVDTDEPKKRTVH